MKRIQPVFLIVAVAMWLPLVLAASTLFGCHTDGGQAAPHLTDQAYTTTTNAVAAVQIAANPATAGPWAPPIQASAAAVLALLAAWQGHCHRRLNTLETNNPPPNKEQIP